MTKNFICKHLLKYKSPKLKEKKADRHLQLEKRLKQRKLHSVFMTIVGLSLATRRTLANGSSN